MNQRLPGNVKSWRRKRKRKKKSIKKNDRENTNVNIKMQQWQSMNPNPLAVKTLYGMGVWRKPTKLSIRKYNARSHAKFHRAIDNHPRVVQELKLVDINESCTSQICTYCGSLMRNSKVGGKHYHHSTYCTNTNKSTGKCQAYGICHPRDQPAADNQLLCLLHQVNTLTRTNNWQQKTRKEMDDIMMESRETGLLHFKPYRGLKKLREKFFESS